MTIEAQFERLTNTLEALVGVLAARNSLLAAPSVTINPEAGAAAIAAGATSTGVVTAAPAAKTNAGPGPGPGRPKTLYFRLENGQVVKSSSKDPSVPGATEITKAEYEAALNPPAPAATTPVVKAAAPEADAFGEDQSAPAAAVTLDDVRTAGLAYRDEKGVDAAKALIASFGVAKLAEVPEARWAEFVAKAKGEPWPAAEDDQL